MKIIANILKKIIDILLTLVIIVGIVFVFLYAIRIEPYVVLSGSMEPTLHVGSLSFINKNVKYEELKKDDIIAYKADSNILVAHRIYSIEDDGIVTKGDANESDDGISVNELNYIGKNIFNIPYVGYGVRFIQTPRGKIISATLVVCLIISAFIFDDEEEKKKKKEKRKSSKKKNKTEEVENVEEKEDKKEKE